MGRIRAVFFDVGDTLIHQWAPKHERFVWLCQQAGVALPDDPARVAAGVIAQERFFQDRQKHPDAKSPAWYARLLREGLVGMGLTEGVEDQVKRLYQAVRSLPNTSVIDPEAEAVLQRLRAEGYRLAIVSNWDGTLLETVRRAGLAGYFDAILDSTVVGSAKPDVTIFQIACAATGVRPEEAVHVGDSLGSDVVGATAAEVQPVLLDPLNLFPEAPAMRIQRLSEVLGLLEMSRAS